MEEFEYEYESLRSKKNPRSSTLEKSRNGRKWRPKTIPQKKKKKKNKKSKYKPSDESLRVLRSVDIIFAPLSLNRIIDNTADELVLTDLL